MPSIDWEVYLHGPRIILERLASALVTGDATVIQMGDDFFLKAKQFEGLQDAAEVNLAAKELAKVISGIAAARLSSHETLSTGGIVRVDDKGGRHSYVIAEASVMHISSVSVRATGTVTSPDGTIRKDAQPAPPVDPVAQDVAAALQSKAKTKAFRLRGEGDADWSTLYKILEVVQTEVPRSEMIRRGWASDTKLTLFKRTANSVTAAGDEARHGAEKEKPPDRPMTLTEARRMIDSILGRWTDTN